MSSPKSPRILLYDIETSYITFRGWRTGKQYVDQSQIIPGKEQNVICVTYKWLDDPKIYTFDWGVKAQNSKRLIQHFTKAVEQSDVHIGYNSDNFDSRHINTQVALHDLPPITWPTSEDLYKQIKRQFYLPSYRLDYVAKLLTGAGKIKIPFEYWVAIVEGKSAWHLEKMKAYNRRDVTALEAVYKRVAAYIKPKASRALILDAGITGCPSCGHPRSNSKGLIWRASSAVQRRQCLKCGHSFTVRRTA